MKIRIVLYLVLMLAVGSIFGQNRTKRSVSKQSVKTAASKATGTKAADTKAIGAWVNFNGGEDVKKLAVDSKNVYVAMRYTKRMVAIDKTTGALKAIEANHEISSVAVAADKCYYYVDREGIFRYDAATGTSEGPLFGFTPEDWYGPLDLYASQDGHYLICGDYLIDVVEGHIISKPGGGAAVNDLGGVYRKSPEAYYTPLDGETYQVSRLGTAVRQFYIDTMTGNVYYCMADGLGVTPIVPNPQIGVKKVQTNFETEHNVALFITRDDEGNFVVTTNFEGVGFGGKSIEDPFRMEKKIASGVKNQWGTELFYTGGDDFITPDGQGNLIFGSDGYACVFIYNPKGINGYADLKGKAVRFE
ncbi:MAG: hypothetical protein K2J63_12850 [Muribaculaceae bacterium]|nr:hypothetical protein [Muribaculaceae bacterium]